MEKLCQEEINRRFIYQKYHFHTPSDTARKMYFYTQAAGHFICEKEFHLWRKEFKSILVKITLDGCGLLHYGNKKYELSRNQAFIIDCNDFQEYYTHKSDRWENKWIHFYGSTSRDYFRQIYENSGPVVSLPENNHIPHCIDSILSMIENQDTHFETRASLSIYQILTELLIASSACCSPAKNHEYNSYIKSARDFIESNYNRHIDVKDIAEAACMSRYHFTRLFKRYTGFNPHEYLVKFRISKAKSLLNDTQSSIESIATQTGFCDTRSFIRTFKKHEEMAPLKYRKTLSKG